METKNINKKLRHYLEFNDYKFEIMAPEKIYSSDGFRILIQRDFDGPKPKQTIYMTAVILANKPDDFLFKCLFVNEFMEPEAYCGMYALTFFLHGLVELFRENNSLLTELIDFYEKHAL